MLVNGNSYSQNSNTNDAFQIVKPLNETWQSLRFSEIKPKGWLKKQVDDNLKGFVGHLDSLVPDLILKDDIYGKDRLSKHVKSKDVGAITDDASAQSQFLWWNSETQSNWRDGYIRNAILADDPYYLRKAKEYIDRILSTQDQDGYLGIYDKELRYKFDNENGELWSKTTLLRGLLAWYGYTKDEKVLTAIEAATKDVMVHYPINKSHPFYAIKPDVGGITHGLMFTDILEGLYRITHHESYREYALFLYKDFSKQLLNEDAQQPKQIDTIYNLKGHGVHTYEHLRALAAAYYTSGNPLLKDALSNFLHKIDQATTPSGGVIGDEWIADRIADATNTGYEYCSLQEVMDGYLNLLLKSGKTKYGDKAERVFLNAAQGARHPSASCITYLKTDNSYCLTGGKNGDITQKTQTRYKYSPVHQDAAVCCVPNAGRITPYYIQNMWMKNGKGFVAMLLGPCEVTTKWNNVEVKIREITNYPNDFNVDFEVEVAHPVTFEIIIRKPSWSKTFSITPSATEKNDYIAFRKTWSGKTKIKLQLYPAIKALRDQNNEYYFMYGPLVLAYPIEAIEKVTKSFPLAGFYDLQYSPVSLVIYQSCNKKVFIDETNKSDLHFKSIMLNPENKQKEEISLVPIGTTILRQVTFK
jgi:DUF1680 family protein